MLRTLIVSATALGLMTGAAVAGPKVMTDEQMDSVVAGATVQTKSGNIVWTVTNLDPLEGYNRGGNGNTAKTAPGLLKAANTDLTNPVRPGNAGLVVVP